MTLRVPTIPCLSLLLLAQALQAQSAPTKQPLSGAARTQHEWPVYGGGNEGTRYSPLRQINTRNVKRLQVAWKFDTGDAFEGSEMQCNPLVIDGVLYATTPKLHVIALDAATGKLKWRFDPHRKGVKPSRARNRGLSYWAGDGQGRLFAAAGAVLYSLDAATGQLVSEFGSGGRVDLREGLGREAEMLTVSLTTPGVVYKDLLIVGSIASEDLPSAPGDVRAYDVRTGALRWSFHTIPRPGEYGHATWPKDAWQHTGGANNWAGMALDEKRGLVFVPTGSAAFDFYGGDRHGDNLFANCLLALRADTGERVWHFQFVRHDTWDRDLPSAPTLVTLRQDGRQIDAVAQITKSGYVFVFERETGKPVFPIVNRPVPASDVPGEKLAEEQPLPLKPPPFSRQVFTEDLATQRTPEAHQAVLKRLRSVRSGGQFTPPSLQGTVIFPGFDGGGEWGGASFDTQSGLLYVNANEMPWILRLVERRQQTRRATGESLYQNQCASCHREDRQGTPPEFPALTDIGSKRTQAEVETVIRKGAGRMPGFQRLGDPAVRALAAYLISGDDKEVVVASPSDSAKVKLPYTHDGYNKFLDPDGYPAIQPPWGTLNAIDLNRGEIRWSIPLGEFPALKQKGMPITGTENYGGPVATAGGVLFIGGTVYDRQFRAFDKTTGRLLWSATLPASGNATPAVYEANGRQFVVIAAGGGKSKQLSGGEYVAFALPEKTPVSTTRRTALREEQASAKTR